MLLLSYIFILHNNLFITIIIILIFRQYRMGGRLALDDALKQVQENGTNGDKAFEGWSEARIRAYQMIEQNPNSYYYRFNAPGEIQRKGQWDAKEREIFFKRLAELGANGQWGIFAMEIPGRVGYQVSLYYLYINFKYISVLLILFFFLFLFFSALIFTGY